MASKIFDTSNLRGDITGGLVAGVIALPLALAFGVQSGLGAAAGLYGAIAVGVFAAIFGGTPTQASGPTGPMTVVSAALVTAATALTGSLDAALGIIFLAFLAGGAFQIVFGLINIAGYVKYFPYPVVSGFMSGVGLIIVLLQVFPFAGLPASKSTISVIQNLPQLANANPYALLIGAITIAIAYLSPKVLKAVPGALVALIVATLIAYFAGWDVPLIGDIPSGIPSLVISDMWPLPVEGVGLILQYGVTLAVLGSIDSLLTSVIADNMTKTKHDSNRELIGQGIGNMVAALFGGIPGAGSTKGTVVNINAGGRTRISGALHGLFLLAVLLGLGSLAAHIPLAVLAGLLIPVGIKIIDFKGLKHLTKVPKADAFVLVIVLLVTTFGDLIQAVGAGVALAALLFMKKSADLAEDRSEVSSLANLPEEQPWPDEAGLYERFKDRVYIKHLYGPLFFGFTAHFKDGVSALPRNIRALVLRMDRVPSIDQSGLYALEEVLFDLQQRGVNVVMVGLQEQPCDMLRRIDVIPDLVAEDELFATVGEAYAHLQVALLQEEERVG